jgi:GR25 family glycosyltransferase involved in LPS biosynthesis
MNILNKYFSKIYVISSYASQNRLHDLLPFFEKEQIEFELVIGPKKKYFKQDYTKTNNTEGVQSCISAIESILLKESFLKSETFCIMEDDVFFDDAYQSKLTNFFDKLPNDWDILNLGYHEYTSLKIDTGLLYYKIDKSERICGSHIVAFKPNTVNLLMNAIENCIFPMDWFLNDDIYPHFNTYVCTEIMFYGASYRENENNKHLFYKKYETAIKAL